MLVLDRALASVVITLLNDSERLLNKKWLRPVISNSNVSIGKKAKQFKLFYFIYQHKEKKHIAIPKIEPENIGRIIAHDSW